MTLNIYYQVSVIVLLISLIDSSAIECVDLEDVVGISISSSDYTPFLSKMHALLFMLVNSPRPIVSRLSILVFQLILQYFRVRVI